MILSTYTLLAIAVLLGLIPAAIAQRKGYSFVGWWLFGFVILIVALPAAFLVRDRRRKCPHCAEPIRDQATVCPHCQRELGAPAAA